MPLPWYKWRVLDWMHCATRFRLSLIERGLYRELLDIHYAEGSIPADTQVLQRMTLATPEEFEKAWANVGRLFEPDPEDSERLVNAKAIEGLIEQQEFREKQSKNGGKGGRPPKKKPKRKPRETHGFSDANPTETQKKPYTVQDSTGQDNPSIEGDGVREAPAQSIPREAEFKHAKMTTDERRNLDERLGPEVAKDYIRRFDRWVAEQPRKRAGRKAYPSILNWFDRDVKAGDVKPPSDSPSWSRQTPEVPRWIEPEDLEAARRVDPDAFRAWCLVCGWADELCKCREAKSA